MHRRYLASTVLALVMAAASAAGALAQSASPGASVAPSDPAAARAWCEAKGGQVQTREAYYGTNNDRSAWVDLGRSMDLCWFEADDEAHSRIYVDLWTLASPTPTLASVAYLSKWQDPDLDPAKGNPASQQCTHMGGTSQFGGGAEGGGWVAVGDDFEIVSMCLFADGSAIEEWGITYYAGGVVRGADLAPLFGWTDQDPLPPFFG